MVGSNHISFLCSFCVKGVNESLYTYALRFLRTPGRTKHGSTSKRIYVVARGIQRIPYIEAEPHITLLLQLILL